LQRATWPAAAAAVWALLFAASSAYQDWDAGYSMADAERFLVAQAIVEFGRPGAWVQLAVVDRADGSLIGDCASCVMTSRP
jgi:hypothetical protein